MSNKIDNSLFLSSNSSAKTCNGWVQWKLMMLCHKKHVSFYKFWHLVILAHSRRSDGSPCLPDSNQFVCTYSQWLLTRPQYTIESVWRCWTGPFEAWVPLSGGRSKGFWSQSLLNHQRQLANGWLYLSLQACNGHSDGSSIPLAKASPLLVSLPCGREWKTRLWNCCITCIVLDVFEVCWKFWRVCRACCCESPKAPNFLLEWQLHGESSSRALSSSWSEVFFTPSFLRGPMFNCWNFFDFLETL